MLRTVKIGQRMLSVLHETPASWEKVLPLLKPSATEPPPGTDFLALCTASPDISVSVTKNLNADGVK